MNKSRKNRIRYEKLLGRRQCNPKIKSSNKHCIPDNILFNVIKQTKRNKTRREIAKKLGCNVNSERCIIEKASIRHTQTYHNCLLLGFSHSSFVFA